MNLIYLPYLLLAIPLLNFWNEGLLSAKSMAFWVEFQFHCQTPLYKPTTWIVLILKFVSYPVLDAKYFGLIWIISTWFFRKILQITIDSGFTILFGWFLLPMSAIKAHKFSSTKSICLTLKGSWLDFCNLTFNISLKDWFHVQNEVLKVTLSKKNTFQID